MNEQQQGHLLVNSTKLLSSIESSTPLPVRTRTVINVIYISGIVFMIMVFFVLLWVNLYSRRCWCWHDTPLIHRFNRQWLLKHSATRNTDKSSSKNQRQQRSSTNDELPS